MVFQLWLIRYRVRWVISVVSFSLVMHFWWPEVRFVRENTDYQVAGSRWQCGCPRCEIIVCFSWQVNLKYGLGKGRKEKDTCTACAGTMILEFAALSRLTGDPIFEVGNREIKRLLGVGNFGFKILGPANFSQKSQQVVTTDNVVANR